MLRHYIRVPVFRMYAIPLIFIRDGEQLRAHSRYAQEAHKVIMRMGEYNYGGDIDQGEPTPD